MPKFNNSNETILVIFKQCELSLLGFYSLQNSNLLSEKRRNVRAICSHQWFPFSFSPFLCHSGIFECVWKIESLGLRATEGAGGRQYKIQNWTVKLGYKREDFFSRCGATSDEGTFISQTRPNFYDFFLCYALSVESVGKETGKYHFQQ